MEMLYNLDFMCQNHGYMSMTKSLNLNLRSIHFITSKSILLNNQENYNLIKSERFLCKIKENLTANQEKKVYTKKNYTGGQYNAFIRCGL